jgi:hypothetical protein
MARIPVPLRCEGEGLAGETPVRENVPPPTNKRDRHGAALWIDERDALTLGHETWLQLGST